MIIEYIRLVRYYFLDVDKRSADQRRQPYLNAIMHSMSISQHLYLNKPRLTDQTISRDKELFRGISAQSWVGGVRSDRSKLYWWGAISRILRPKILQNSG